MTDETVTELERFEVPYGREIVLQNVVHESGMRVLRVRIREGRRFTIMDLDTIAATRLGTAMTEWSRA